MNRIDRIIRILSGLMFVVMVGVIAINVFSRFITRKSFAWTEEISYLAFAYVMFLGITILFKRNSMIAVTIVADHLPPKGQRILMIVTYFLLIIANFMLTYFSGLLTVEGWVRRTAILNIPYSFIYFAAPVSFFLMGCYSTGFFLKALRGEEIHLARSEEQA